MRTIFHIIPNLNSGGAENFLQVLSHSLSNSTKQYIFTFKDPKEDHLFSNFNEKVTLFHSKRQLLAEIKKFKSPLIMCWMYPSIFYFEKLRMLRQIEAEVVWNIRHSLFLKWQIKQKLGLLFLGLYSRIRKVRIVYCAYSAKRFHEKFLFSTKSTKVIHNRYSKNLPYKEPIKEDPFLLYIGRYNYLKGSDRLISIYQSYCQREKEPLKLLIAGYGWKQNHLPDPLKDQIEILGNVNNLEELYANATALLFTSRSEGYPNVLVEASSFGLPIIATIAGDSQFILKDYPLGFSVHSIEEFVEKLINLKKPTKKYKMEIALKFRAQFDFKKTVQEYLNFIILT
ncbi:MAG: glycosyltransferase family 4 protein [Flavobacteriaceae bacterium]